MRRQIIFLIIIGLVVFVVGAGLGFFYGDMGSDPAKADSDSNLVGVLSSSVASGTYLSGTIAGISVGSITIKSLTNDETVQVDLIRGVKISRLEGGGKDLTQRTSGGGEVGALKPGDRINVKVLVSPEGAVQAEEILILVAN